MGRLREWTREGNGEVEGVDKGREWGRMESSEW